MSATAQTADWTAFHTTEQERREWASNYQPALDRSPLLDEPSEPHPILSALMDGALSRILLVSDGAVMPLRERTTGSQSPPSAPTSDLAALLDELGNRFSQCKTHRRRLEVIKEAQVTAVRLVYSPDRSKIHGTKEWREAIAHDSRDNETIALDHGITDRTVRNIRKEFGTMRANGRPKRKTVVAGSKRK